MAKRSRKLTVSTIGKHLKEGRGSGRDASYIPGSSSMMGPQKAVRHAQKERRLEEFIIS